MGDSRVDLCWSADAVRVGKCTKRELHVDNTLCYGVKPNLVSILRHHSQPSMLLTYTNLYKANVYIRVTTIVWKTDNPIIDSIGQNNWPMR